MEPVEPFVPDLEHEMRGKSQNVVYQKSLGIVLVFQGIGFAERNDQIKNPVEAITAQLESEARHIISGAVANMQIGTVILILIPFIQCLSAHRAFRTDQACFKESVLSILFYLIDVR